MRKSFNTTLILAAVFAVLMAWYILYEKRYKLEQTTKEENTKRLVSFESEQIQEVEIHRAKNPPGESEASKPMDKAPDYEIIKLKKTGSDWSLLEPVQDLADNSTVSSSLGTLTTTKQERIVEEKPADLTPFGLKYPIARVIVKKDSSTPAQEVLIGANTPVGFSSYAKLANSDAVFRVSRSLRTTFEKDSFAYRNKLVTNLQRGDIQEVELQTPKENIVLKKGEKDAWLLARENMPADTNEINKTLGAITDMRASHITDTGTVQSPVVKIALTSEKEPKRTGITIWKSKDKYFAKRDDRPTIYEIPKTTVDPLQRPGNAYRNLNLVLFNRYEVKRIKMERGDASFELTKNDIGWAFPNEPTQKVDPAQVDSLLTKLQDTKIKQFLGKKDDPRLKQPKLIVHLFEKKDKTEVETATLSFSTPDKKDVFVKRNGLDTVFTIREEDFAKINAPKQSYVQQEVKPVEKKEPEKKSE